MDASPVWRTCGHATPVVWLKIAMTCLAPLCVANYGILVATRGRLR